MKETIEDIRRGVVDELRTEYNNFRKLPQFSAMTDKEFESYFKINYPVFYEVLENGMKRDDSLPPLQ